MARYLDAAGDYLRTAGTAADVNGAEVTVAGWIKLPSGNAEWEKVIEVGGWFSGSGGIEIGFRGGTLLSCLVYQDGGGGFTTIVENVAFTLDTWIPFVFRSVASGAGRKHNFRTEGVQRIHNTSCDRYAQPARINIGTHGGDPNNTAFNLKGSVARFAVWSSYLSDEDVEDFEAGALPSTIATASLVRDWSIAGDDSPEPDAEGNQDLTVTGDAVQVEGPPEPPANTPPSAPSNVAGTTPADATSTITWDDATDTESDPLQYEGRWRQGATEVEAFELQTFAGDLEYESDTSGLASGEWIPGVRAHDGTDYGDWAEGDAVTVDHQPEVRVTQVYEYDVLAAGHSRVSQVYEYDVLAAGHAQVTQVYVYDVLPDVLVPPVITIEAINEISARVTVVSSGGSYADDHDLYLGLSLSTLLQPENIVAANLGPVPPIEITLEDLTPGLVYYAVLRATYELGGANSVPVSVEMPAWADAQLVATSINTTSATLQLVNVDTAEVEESQFETTTFHDFSYENPISASGVLTEDTEEYTRLVWPMTDLFTANTQYRSRARFRRTGELWRPWIEIAWFTDTENRPGDSLAYWASPEFGEVISGTYCPKIHIEAGRTVTLIEITDPIDCTGATGEWDVLEVTPTPYQAADEDLEYLEFCFDTTEWADGFYRLRFTLNNIGDGAVTVITHYGFRIVNGIAPVSGLASSFPMARHGGTAPIWKWALPVAGYCTRTGEHQPYACYDMRLLEPQSPVAACSTRWPYWHVWGHVGSNELSFGPVDPPWLARTLEVDVTATFYSLTEGVGWWWEQMQAGELVTMGVGVGGRPGQLYPPIAASVESSFAASMLGAYATAWNPNFSLQGLMTGTATLTIGPYTFTRPLVSTYVGWLDEGFQVMSYQAGVPVWGSYRTCGFKRAVPIRLCVYRPDADNYPLRWRAIAHFIDPNVRTPIDSNPAPGFSTAGTIVTHASTSRALDVVIDETVDLDYDLYEECGGISFFFAKPPGGEAPRSGKFVHYFSAVPLAGEIDCEPPPPTLDIPIEVNVECGNVVISATAGEWGGPDVDSASLEIRVSSTLEVIYTNTQVGSAEWTFDYGVHSLPMDTLLEARIQAIIDGDPSDWTDWTSFTIDSWVDVEEITIIRPTVYSETWDGLIEWSGDGETFSIFYRIVRGDWIEIVNGLTAYSYNLPEEILNQILSSGGEIQICGYAYAGGVVCDEVCTPVAIGLIGVRRILFGQPGGDSIEISHSPKRRIIFGELGNG